MACNIVEQCVYIVKTYFENGSSVVRTYRAIRDYFGVQNRPSEKTIRNIVHKFETTRSFQNEF